ncbi:hypothetical protein DM860_009662 [Cuscuta australis]|uniref:pectinesterase n=1 Tax=Cuscuta australis TaxID=267555 RepID=A0A328DMD5_9ASTE|nr:hypothetical protein DM860_009662 [Cuscuta australis]
MQLRRCIKPPAPPSSSTRPIAITKPFTKLKSTLILMAALLSLSLLLFFSLSAASRHRPFPPPGSSAASSAVVHEACKASRDPPSCETSLSKSDLPGSNVLEVIRSAISVTSRNLETGRAMTLEILKGFSGNLSGSNAANNCLEFLEYAEYRISLANLAFPGGGRLKDARAWMSSALVYQYDCWSALKYVNSTSLVGRTMSFLDSSLIRSCSDALAMMVNFDIHGEKTESWGPPKTERDGFWEPVRDPSGSNLAGGVPAGLKPDVTVCKGGSQCDYKTVQEAVNAAPDNEGSGKQFVILIKAGVYEEIVRVPLEKKNMVFLGDGMGKTVITGSMNVGQQGVTTFNSATVGVVGDGFMASGVTFENTAGPDAHQAVAFRSDSDLSVVENCEFLGNQDTLYAHALRQYYKSCRIQGNVDFIFGNSAAFFQDCLVLVAPRQINPEKGEKNAVTAHGRIDAAQSTGFVFQNCVINGTDAYMGLYFNKPSVHKNYLGRPWKQYSRTVFIQCTLEALVSPQGWLPWSGDFALDTLYYGEFENTGAGSNTSGRVPWTSQIPGEHVRSYSVGNFIQGDQWIPTSSS